MTLVESFFPKPKQESASAIQLTEFEGDLSFNGECLLYVYPAGDCDTFSWPLDTQFRTREKQLEQIEETLYGMREMGKFSSHVQRAYLPDGTWVNF